MGLAACTRPATQVNLAAQFVVRSRPGTAKGSAMPRGPKGEKRPADVIGNAVHVMRIATGEAEDRACGSNQNAPRAEKARARREALNQPKTEGRKLPETAAKRPLEKDALGCFVVFDPLAIFISSMSSSKLNGI